MTEVYVGRQPIFDAEHTVVGYELLFRGSREASTAELPGADKATSQVIVNTFLDMGIDAVVGDRKPFINTTRTFLTGELPFPLEPGVAVLEITQGLVADATLTAGMTRMREQGHQFALDD